VALDQQDLLHQVVKAHHPSMYAQHHRQRGLAQARHRADRIWFEHQNLSPKRMEAISDADSHGVTETAPMRNISTNPMRNTL
jgi:hypothetical protein